MDANGREWTRMDAKQLEWNRGIGASWGRDGCPQPSASGVLGNGRIGEPALPRRLANGLVENQTQRTRRRREPQREGTTKTSPSKVLSAKHVNACFRKLLLWVFYDVEIIYTRIFKDLDKLFIGLEGLKKWHVK